MSKGDDPAAFEVLNVLLADLETYRRAWNDSDAKLKQALDVLRELWKLHCDPSRLDIDAWDAAWERARSLLGDAKG